MPEHILINGRKIGVEQPPFIIAEMSANHNGSIERAFSILEMVKRSGADAVKIQTYTPDTITMQCDRREFKITEGLWAGQTLYDLYEQAHLPWDWHKPLFERARDLGLTIFSSPFDKTAVDLLEDLGTPAYKIASFEAIDLPLISYVASTGKPMIISTGMADANEINEAITCATENGCHELVILHCVSGYPAPAEDYNLNTLSDMKDRFGCLLGLSDHTINNVTAIAAIAKGACLIEKHVTLDRQGGGPDDSFSLEEPELTQLCQDSLIAWQSLGKVNYSRTSSEQGNAQFRRSLYVVRNVKAGDEISEQNVRSIRPGFGLAPKCFNQVVGKKFTCDVSAGSPLNYELIEDI